VTTGGIVVAVLLLGVWIGIHVGIDKLEDWRDDNVSHAGLGLDAVILVGKGLDWLLPPLLLAALAVVVKAKQG
jgi:hypothetical protein